MADAPPEVRERLLKAWEGEIVAGGVYELISRRMPEREGEILRRMAEAEAGHRRRLEQRMQELGIERPDPSSVAPAAVAAPTGADRSRRSTAGRSRGG